MVACGSANLDRALETAQQETQVVVQQQVKEEATSNALTQISAQKTEDSIATEDAASDRSTATAMQKTAVKITQAAIKTSTAEPFSVRVQELDASGYISNSEGDYYNLPTFNESWAQIRWYKWWHTDHSPTDFVIRADAEWNSASDKADLFFSGCGFVFREQDEDNHYLAYLGLYGYVHFTRVVNGRWSDLGFKYYDKVGYPEGSAEIELVVEGDKFTFFVNGEQVHTRQDTALPSGNLALTLLSGTNKGYGTKCKMSNIDLWVLD